jgi:hypothetical protein
MFFGAFVFANSRTVKPFGVQRYHRKSLCASKTSMIDHSSHSRARAIF